MTHISDTFPFMVFTPKMVNTVSAKTLEGLQQIM